MKNKYGLFGNLDQTCRRQAGVPLLIVTLIVAVGLSVTGCPDSVQPPVVESVSISTDPVDATTVTRGVPLQFTAEVLPAGVSQAVTWNVNPSYAGSFNAANEFEVSDTLAHGTQVTITATAAGTSVVSSPITLAVNVIPTSVTIAVPPDTAMVTRSVPLPFTVDVLPAGAPQAVTWNVNPPNAGSFNATNEFTVSEELAHGTPVTITATAVGTSEVSNEIELTVNVNITGVNIATYPANATTVTRDVPLQFIAEVLPAGGSQAVTWNITPPYAGDFKDNDEFFVYDGLAYGTQVTITATAAGTNLESDPITLTVNVIPTGVTIAVPAGTTAVTRGEPLPFTVDVQPTGAPQAVTWNIIYPANAGSFNADNEFTVSNTLAHGTQVTITATAASTNLVSNEIELTVNVIPMSVTIATVPTGAVEVTRGISLPFTADVHPTGAPQAVTWNVNPAYAGNFAGNVFTVSEELDHGTLVAITATATDTSVVSAPINLTVHVRQGLMVSIDWADFYGLAPDAEDIDIGPISILTGGNITLSNVPNGVGNDDIRWYLDGSQIGTGATLGLRSEHLGTLLGPRSVTLVVIVNGSPYSKRIAFTVTM